ncbi:MAG: hypothetical protein ACXW61_11400 [Gemmatirosa sp.]
MLRLAPSLAALTVLAGSLHAQPTERDRRLAELDRDVWRPFVEGVRRDSAPLYVGVHGRDFHWVAPGDSGRVMDRAEYDADSRMVMRRRREEGGTSEIDVRFLERNVTESFAAEKVVTRFVIRRPGREPQIGHGIAHYFSRREGGVWRIQLRYGSTERATAATFDAATPPTAGSP